MSAINVGYYIAQVVLFTAGAALMIFFADFMRKEVQLNGWGVTPRLVRAICLCCSCFGFLVVQLDTFGALGIYRAPWQLFVGHVEVSLLVGAACSSLYMYVLVSFKAESVPLIIVRLWVASNVGGFIVVFILALIGAVTDNLFWSFVCTCVLLCQETFLYAGFLIVVCRTTRVLKSMGQTTDYTTQICKLWKVMAFAATVFTLAFSSQAAQLKVKKDKWGMPATQADLQYFQFSLFQPHLVLLAAHCLLLFMLRPPKSRLLSIARIRLGPDGSPLPAGRPATLTRSSKSSRETHSKSSKTADSEVTSKNSNKNAAAVAPIAAVDIELGSKNNNNVFESFGGDGGNVAAEPPSASSPPLTSFSASPLTAVRGVQEEGEEGATAVCCVDVSLEEENNRSSSAATKD